MKQNTKSKTSSRCYSITEAWVSSAKGTSGNFEIFRSTLKQTQTKRNMKLHENDLNPGPLTDAGFSRFSRCQANVQANGRMPAKLTVNGQPGLMSVSGERSPGIGQGLAYDYLPRGLKSVTYAWSPGCMNLYPDFISSGFMYCFDKSTFRQRSPYAESKHAHAEFRMPVFEPTDRNASFRNGELPALLKHLRRELISEDGINALFQTGNSSVDRTISHWHRTSGLNRLNHLQVKPEFANDVESRLTQNARLSNC